MTFTWQNASPWLLLSSHISLFLQDVNSNSLSGQLQLNYSLIGSPLLEIIVCGKSPHIALLQHFFF